MKLDIHPLEKILPVDVMRMVRSRREAGASFVAYAVNLPDRHGARRAQVSSDAGTDDALRSWLASNGHPEEPYTSAAMDLVNEMGAQG